MAITASDVYYIKLGRGGIWEDDCINKTQTLRIGYYEVNHKDCLNKNWASVKKQLTSKVKDVSTASRFTNELRKFYEADEGVLWITFSAGKMWWCFSKPEIKTLGDGGKIRQVIGKWCDTDIGNTYKLRAENLSGDLLKTQAFRGTICDVKLKEYVLAKINGKVLPEVKEAKDTLIDLEKKISDLIKLLHWKDFEILVDLIFRQAGWQRTGNVGKTQKTLDLDLMSPVTHERCMVQIKSASTLDDYKEFCENSKAWEGYQKIFYIVHTPHKSLIVSKSNNIVKLLFLEDIAKLVVKAGLTDWLISKVS